MISEPLSLRDLGWSPYLQSCLDMEDLATAEPARVSAVHRDGVDTLSPGGERRVATLPALPTSAVAVGDWLLLSRDTGATLRLVERKSLISRRAAGTGATTQLIAANLDTLFVVSSCNADFNPARLERYLALARQARVTPVVALTRADACADPDVYVDAAREVSGTAEVLALNACDPAAVARLDTWCGTGETAALVGMSGVGKSTLTNALTGGSEATGPIREADARGRHTTTARAMRRARAGGWLIDTPGMRALRLADAAEGIAAVFEDIASLAGDCRFRDCGHEGEPGCAVEAAIGAGTLDPARLARWRKLAREEAHNSATLVESRRAGRAVGRISRQAMADKRARRDG